MQLKAYQPHDTDIVFTTFQKYIFNVHEITASGEKLHLFSGDGTGKNKAQNSPKHAISSEQFNFIL